MEHFHSKMFWQALTELEFGHCVAVNWRATLLWGDLVQRSGESGFVHASDRNPKIVDRADGCASRAHDASNHRVGTKIDRDRLSFIEHEVLVHWAEIKALALMMAARAGALERAFLSPAL